MIFPHEVNKCEGIQTTRNLLRKLNNNAGHSIYSACVVSKLRQTVQHSGETNTALRKVQFTVGKSAYASTEHRRSAPSVHITYPKLRGAVRPNRKCSLTFHPHPSNSCNFSPARRWKFFTVLYIKLRAAAS